MYPRMARNFYNVSFHIKKQNSLKNAGLVLSVGALNSLKIFPCSASLFVNNYCTKAEQPFLPKEPTERKNYIEQNARAKLEEMMKENPELEKQKKIYELEIDIMKQDGDKVPSNLRDRDWVELLKLKSYRKRRQFLEFLFSIEMKKKHELEIKMEKRLLKEISKEDLQKKKEQGEIVYGVTQNSFLRRITMPTMNHLWNWNCIRSMMMGNKIVFDCSYEKYMSQQELKSSVKQILESYAINRTHDYPFHIYLCNVDMSSYFTDILLRHIPTLFDDDFPITVTEKSYSEIFEKDKLRYLSSDAPQMLDKIDPDCVYIIGTYVDKGPKKRISIGKAQEEGIKAVSLPVDKYVHLGGGASRDLTLNGVVNILLDAQQGDWKKAFQHIPSRWLYSTRVDKLEREIQKSILRTKNKMQLKTENDEQFKKENKQFKEKKDFERKKHDQFNFKRSSNPRHNKPTITAEDMRDVNDRLQRLTRN